MSEGSGISIDLRGHVALVTGGGRGIGRACSLALGRAGADVVVQYRGRESDAREVADELARLGRRALILRADLGEASEAANLVREAADGLGDPTILVNNVGIWEGREVEGLSREGWDRTFAVNVRSMFLVTRAAVPAMKRRGDGRIVNIASTAGQRGEALHSDYAASKGAVIAFTRSLGSELAPSGIRANCVAPGWVDTEMCAEVFADGGREAIARTIPMGRVARPEEIASVVLFAASDLSTFMTGSVLSVNGGAVMA